MKHTKFRNTGILFELLVRKIASDIVSNKNSQSNEIIKEYFSTKKELNKELRLYQTLLKDKFVNENQAERFIDKVLESRKKLDNKQLKQEKYKLIGEIKENFDLDEFFKARVENYKVHASVYKLFEDIIGNSINPADVITSRNTLLEHITNKKVPKETIRSQVMEEYEKLDKDIKLLAYKSLVERFNEKYSVLNEKQKNLLKQYINNVSNTTTLRDYIDQEIPKIKEELQKHIDKIDDQIIKIKYDGITNQIESLLSGPLAEDTHVLQLMRFYQLEKEMKNLEK